MELIFGHKHKRMDGRTDGRTDGQTDGWTDRRGSQNSYLDFPNDAPVTIARRTIGANIELIARIIPCPHYKNHQSYSESRNVIERSQKYN